MKKIISLILSIIICLFFTACSNDTSKSEPIKMDLIAVKIGDDVIPCELAPDKLKGFIEFDDSSFTSGYVYSKCDDSSVDGNFSGEFDKELNGFKYSIRMEGETGTAVCVIDRENGKLAALFIFASAPDMMFYFEG